MLGEKIPRLDGYRSVNKWTLRRVKRLRLLITGRGRLIDAHDLHKGEEKQDNNDDHRPGYFLKHELKR